MPAPLSASGASGLGALARMGLLVLGAFVAVAVEIAPLGLAAAALPGPDLLFCLVAYWALRIPAAAPVLLVFALGLGRDLLTDQPVGLGALTLVLAAEALKARRAALQRQPFLFEWVWVGMAAGGMMLAQWLGLVLTLADAPALALLLQQYAATLLVYPALAAVLRWVIRIRDERSETVRPGGERG